MAYIYILKGKKFNAFALPNSLHQKIQVITLLYMICIIIIYICIIFHRRQRI